MDRVSPEVLARRAKWIYRGTDRPGFAEPAGPGQESVWDYPRPPRMVADPRRIEVRLGDEQVALTYAAVRILETASPPTVYVPPGDVCWKLLQRSSGASHCEWKGHATHWNVASELRKASDAAWSYEDPYPEFARIRNYVSFYPSRVSCWIEDERVSPQPGGYYGGWVTPEIVGPFKGEPGTEQW